MAIPHGRYDFRLSHLSHITPPFGLPGNNGISERLLYAQRFLLRPRSTSEIEPETFGSLEYQFNRASVSLMIKPKINSFFTVVQKLPEARIDIPRQELFKNIYYQSQSSFEYLKMSWRTYDRKPKPSMTAFADPKDYESARFDTTHFLYYPDRLEISDHRAAYRRPDDRIQQVIQAKSFERGHQPNGPGR